MQLLGLALILCILLSLLIAFGGPMLRKLLPKDHRLQRYLTDAALETALVFVQRNWRKVFGWGLLLVLSVITIVYS